MQTCLCSLSDSSSFLGANRDPVDRMLCFLKDMFHPTKVESDELSLAISSGRGGARLSHSHARQYTYLYQTLTLWRAILHDFFKLWCLAEEDLLDSANPYSLRDTGQGLNRVQGVRPAQRSAAQRPLPPPPLTHTPPGAGPAPAPRDDGDPAQDARGVRALDWLLRSAPGRPQRAQRVRARCPSPRRQALTPPGSGAGSCLSTSTRRWPGS